MSERIYKATLSQSQGREGWSVIFKHPVLPDRSTGKPGRRVRRGLGTKDRKAALKLIAELNELLADKLYWEPSSRATAEGKFAAIVVDIFYHDLTPAPVNPLSIRDAAIPLPRSTNSEYRQVLLLGSTGGGKSTLVRQLIGMDARTERFPATSTTKTSVADTEVVLSPGSYRAVVTFRPRDEIRDYVEDCMAAAINAAADGQPDSEVLRLLLTHVNQRFRLSYVLGTGEDAESGEDDDSISTGPAFDLPRTRKLLGSALKRLRSIAERQFSEVHQEVLETEEDESLREEVFEELLDTRLHEDETFITLADEIMDEIKRRFELVIAGEIENTKQGWPRAWTFESEDRQQFLAEISRFSSNYAPSFGTLLTPLVNGIRVAGPFSPVWSAKQPPLVLFDVEGLGHSPDSTVSLPTTITRRLDTVDAVLLVDNATQPMQTPAVSALRNLAANGYAGKLIVCFTHFDGVGGDNLPNVKMREQHVLASAENALTSIGEQIGSFGERVLRIRLRSASFFLGDLQRSLSPESKSEKRTIDRLHDLLNVIDRMGVWPELGSSRPEYDRMYLAFAAKRAIEEFHANWSARLGVGVKLTIFKYHWAQVKALVRRISEGWDDEYLDLKPIGDLHRQLQENIYREIQNPAEWDGDVPSDDEKQRIYDSLARQISLRLLVLVTERMGNEVIADWKRAFYLKGQRSFFLRALMILHDIYKRVAELPDYPSPFAKKFLEDVMTAVRESADVFDIALL